jgi:hypothetical protein
MALLATNTIALRRRCAAAQSRSWQSGFFRCLYHSVWSVIPPRSMLEYARL